MKTDELLPGGIPLFRGVSPGDMPGLLRCLGARRQSFREQEIILLAGQPARFVGVMLSGAAQVVREDFAGGRNIIAEVTAGNLFAESYVCSRAESLPVSVVAAADCKVLWIDYARAIAPCSGACPFHARLVENMMRILASKNLLLSRKIEDISRRTTREKLLSYLTDEASAHGSNEFGIPFSRQELADYLCVDRSAMSGELGRMRDDGLLRFHGSRFVLTPGAAREKAERNGAG